MGRSEPPAGTQPTPLYFSNPDVIYANEFPAARFGQGCFAAALSTVYAAVSKQPRHLPLHYMHASPACCAAMLLACCLTHDYPGPVYLSASRLACDGTSVCLSAC